VASQGEATRVGDGVPVRADGTKRSGVGAGRGAEAEERDGWGDRCRDITKEIHLSPPLFASGGSQGSFSKYIWTSNIVGILRNALAFDRGMIPERVSNAA